MNRLPLSIALATGALLLTACGQDETPAESADNPLLRYVPADTPYVMANLAPVPADLVDTYLARMDPFTQQMEATLGNLRKELAEESAEGVDADEAEAMAVADAVLAEFEGKLNREGLESLGLSLESLNAFYGHGMFPIMRLGLGDAEKVRAMLDRVQARSGVTMPEQNFQGVAYWRAGGADEPIAIYLAILGDHLAITSAPISEEAGFLPTFLALEMPERSLADSGALAELNRDKGFTPYGSGYIDLERVADEMFDDSSQTTRWMRALGDFDPAAIDPACKQEARLFTAFVPRLVAGATEVEADQVTMRYQVETSSWLGEQLVQLVGDVPPAPENTDRMMSLSLNLQMGRAVNFVRENAAALAARPFNCPPLREMNNQIQRMAEMSNQPMPPFIGNLNGLRAELSDFDIANPSMESLRGRLSLEMESPQMVIGMASMMIPGFEELQIEPGADPVALPQELLTLQTPEFEAYAVMSKNAIGVSIGKDEQTSLREFLDRNGKAEGVFLSVDYDSALVARMQRQMSAEMQSNVNVDPSGMEDIDAVMSHYESMLGRARFDLSFSEDGLTIDNRQSFR